MIKENQTINTILDQTSSHAFDSLSPLSSECIENPEIEPIIKIKDEEFNGTSEEVLSEIKERTLMNSIQNVLMTEGKKIKTKGTGSDQFFSLSKALPENSQIEVELQESPECDLKSESKLLEVKNEGNKENESLLLQVSQKPTKNKKMKTKIHEEIESFKGCPEKKVEKKCQEKSQTVSSNANSITKLEKKESFIPNPKIKHLKKEPEPCTPIQKLFISSIVSSACIVTCFLGRVDENACALLSTGVFFGTLCILK